MVDVNHNERVAGDSTGNMSPPSTVNRSLKRYFQSGRLDQKRTQYAASPGDSSAPHAVPAKAYAIGGLLGAELMRYGRLQDGASVQHARPLSTGSAGASHDNHRGSGHAAGTTTDQIRSRA